MTRNKPRDTRGIRVSVYCTQDGSNGPMGTVGSSVDDRIGTVQSTERGACEARNTGPLEAQSAVSLSEFPDGSGVRLCAGKRKRLGVTTNNRVNPQGLCSRCSRHEVETSCLLWPGHGRRKHRRKHGVDAGPAG